MKKWGQIKFVNQITGGAFSKGYKYIGEWSSSATQPNGKGVRINCDGSIQINTRKYGRYSPGNYLRIWPDNEFRVGEYYIDPNG